MKDGETLIVDPDERAAQAEGKQAPQAAWWAPMWLRLVAWAWALEPSAVEVHAVEGTPIEPYALTGAKGSS